MSAAAGSFGTFPVSVDEVIWAADALLVLAGLASTVIVGLVFRSRLGGHAIVLSLGLFMLGAAHLVESVSDAAEVGHETVEVSHRALIVVSFVLLSVGGWLTGRELMRRGLAVGTAERARVRAEGESQAQRQFLSRMSHELRTPMNAVLGFGQLLQMDDLTPEQREHVDYIMSSGRHLLQLIDEVLDISRVEAGKMDFASEPFSPIVLANALTEMMGPAASSAGVTLAVEPGPESVLAFADVQRTKQALLNLLSNAVKYNRPGGRVTVRIDADPAETVRIHVQDTGRGISADKLGRLFSPFDRLDADKSGIQGTGLGLAYSRALVEAMNGSLTVESIEGSGSTFTLALPLAARREVQRQGSATPGGRKVLHIEDSLADFEVVEHALNQLAEVQCVLARTGLEGFELAREFTPDVALIDVQLPDMSGLDVLALFQADQLTARMPVVMLSARESAPVAEQARVGGAAAVLSKPLNPNDLVQTVSALFPAEQASAA